MQRNIILGLLSVIMVLLLAAAYVYAGMYVAKGTDRTVAVEDEINEEADTEADTFTRNGSVMTDDEVVAMQARLEADPAPYMTDEEVAAMNDRLSQ